MRIAVVTETYPPEVNGVAMTIGRMVDGLVRRGHRIELVRPRQTGDDRARSGDRLDEVLVRGLPIPRYQGLRMGLPGTAALARRWSRDRPDIVHVVTEGPLGWSAVKAARRLRIPVTSDYHTHFASYSDHYGIGWLTNLVSAYLKRLHNRTDLTFVPTAALADELRTGGYADLAVVARGIDVALFTPERRSAQLRAAWGVPEEGLVVLHVGRMAPEKNVPLALKAFEAMRAVRADLRLVLVGDGPERATLERRHPEFIFAGMRHGEDLATHYASGDVFLFPSLTETFGNVTLEALASGLAVVAYDYAAATEVIRHEKTGLLVAPADESAFAAAARRLASEPDLLRTLRAAARSAALPLDWERIHSSFAEALVDVVRDAAVGAAQAGWSTAVPD